MTSNIQYTSVIRFNTDTYGSWGIGQKDLPKDATRNQVMYKVFDLKANVVVKPKTGKWYFKGINNNKTYDTIKSHLEENQQNSYHHKTKTLLIKYSNEEYVIWCENNEEEFDWLFS